MHGEDCHDHCGDDDGGRCRLEQAGGEKNAAGTLREDVDCYEQLARNEPQPFKGRRGSVQTGPPNQPNSF